jgi:LacI family transcriptional regulator, galactose operon repressor
MSLTLEHIARLANVSRSTVSRVVNDEPNVRPELREQIWQVIRETGYQPHAAARSLVTRRTRIVGVIIPEALTKLFTDPFFPRLLYGITETCNARHYYLNLALCNGPAEQEEMYRRVLGSGHLDGVIVASAHPGDPLFPKLLENGVPFVLAGRHPDERVNYVDVDNVGGARMAVEHLIRLGHTRIATITGPLTMTSGEDRLVGYRQALEAQRLAVDEQLVVEGDYTEGGGALAMRRLLAASPTAVFVASDVMAIGALKALREAGLRVPQDVALVGFDDVTIATAVEPALTTVRQPIGRLGSMAADLLLDLLEKPPDPTERVPSGHSPTGQVARIVLPTNLVVRDSCGALL